MDVLDGASVLVGAVAVLAAFAAVYLKKVVEPNLLRLDVLAAQARPSAARELGTGRGRPSF